MSKYRYNEDKSLAELQEYIDSTYGEHYSKSKFQATEFIIDGGHGEGFCIGNIMKYAQRYGKKDGYNRKDIMKVIHYAIIMLHVHDSRENSEEDLSAWVDGGVVYDEAYWDALAAELELVPDEDEEDSPLSLIDDELETQTFGPIRSEK